MVKKPVEKGKLIKKRETDTFPNGYDPEQVRSGVKALFAAVEKDDSKKKSLFSAEGDFVLLQVACVRIPKLTRRNYRYHLPHGFLRDTSEVCLFVRNLHGSKDLEYENTVLHYKNFLSEAGVTSVHEVISVNQLKQEFKTYEMKRRLAARFDFFLGDAVVNNWLNGVVGKNFHRCKKVPNPVKLDAPDLKGEIDRALHKTTMVVTGHGDNFGVKIGNTHQPINHVCENIDAFVKSLQENFPGKWGNVRSLYIRVTDGVSIPIYVAVVIPNSVKVPKVKPRPENKRRPVDEGELSTLPDGFKVRVEPDGTVIVKKPPKAVTKKKEEDEVLSNEEEDFFDEDEVSDMEDDGGDDDGDDDGEVSDAKEEEVKEDDDEGSESEEDSGVEAAEEAYLQELTKENEIKKKRKGEEEPTPPAKIQKKMKVEEPIISKNDKKKVKDLNVGKSMKNSKRKDIVEEKSASIAKNSSKGRSVPSSMQWQVEDVVDKATKQNESKAKIAVKAKSVDKGLVSKKGAISEPKVKVKAESEEKIVKKLEKKKSVTGPPNGAANGKVKKSKAGKVKNG